MVRRVTVPSDPVAIVGCGSSRLIAELVADGYTGIVAVDIAQSAIDQLRVSLGDDADRVTSIRGDARSVRLPSTVALWHDRATFHFLTDEADQRAYAASAARSVHLGGHLVLAEFAVDGPTSCSGLTVVRHSVTSLQSVFLDGFELVESFERDHVTPSGAVQRFVHALLIRRDLEPVIDTLTVIGSSQ